MTLQRRAILLAPMLLSGIALALWASPDSKAVNACTSTWNGNVANWNTASEWTPSGVPGITDVVCINSGAATLTGTSASVREVRLTAPGQLFVDNTSLTVDDPGVAGSNPDGLMTVNAGTSLQETGTSTAISGGTLINAGVVQVASGSTRAFKFGSSTHSGQFLVNETTDMFVPGGSTLTNTGTINVAASKRLTSSALTLNQNAGQITGGAGSTFEIQNGAINHTGGDVGSSVTVGIFGGSITPSGTGTAAYTVGLGGQPGGFAPAGTTLAGDIASGKTLRVRGGEFGFPQNSAKLTLNANRTNNGTITLDSIDQTLGPNATLDLGTNTLTNNGTISVIDGAGGLRTIAGASGALGNTSSGTLDINRSTTFEPTVTNAGTVGIVQSETATFVNHNYTQTAGSTSGLGTLDPEGGPIVALQGGLLSLGGSIAGDLSNTGGDVSPAGSPSAPENLTISGDYNQSSGGTLTTDVTGAGAYDALVVLGGDATLDGTIKVVSTGFTPASANTFDVVQADQNVFGSFATKTQVGGGGRTYGITYVTGPPGRARLTVVPQFALTVNKAGAGSGGVSSNPAGILCGTACTQDYDETATVTLTATPAAGSSFSGWSGAGCSGTGTCQVTMSQARSVTATFTLISVAAVPPDRVAPQASGLAVSPSPFRAASRGASIAAVRRPIGTTVRYRLSEAAKVRFTVQREKAGRKVGKACKAPTRANRTKRSCKRYVAVAGSFTHTGKNGANSFKFTGRLGGRKLAPGTYRLTGVPTDAAGNRGLARYARFTIAR